MLRTLAVGTALLIAAVACSGSGDDDASLTATPSDSPPPLSTQVVREAGDYWFFGAVREVNSGCAADGICSVTVEVLKPYQPMDIAAGETVEVIETFGFSNRSCLGEWSSSAQIGDEVDVLAGREDAERLQICDSERYFVERVNVDHE